MGKTALIEMLSKLWNQSLLTQWKRRKGRILDFMRKRLDLSAEESTDENYMVLYICCVVHIIVVAYTGSKLTAMHITYISIIAWCPALHKV